MENFFNELISRINAGNGFGLTVIGMGVVFCGLLTLFITMQILEKAIDTIDEKKRKKEQKSKPRTIGSDKEEANMDEVAAAIGLAFKMYQLMNSPKKITIKRIARSAWKESLRARAMENL